MLWPYYSEIFGMHKLMQAANVSSDSYQFKIHTLNEIPQSQSNVALFLAIAIVQFLIPHSQSKTGWLEGLGLRLKVMLTLALHVH